VLCGPRTMTMLVGTPIGALLGHSEASSVGRGRSRCARGDTGRGPAASGRAGKGPWVAVDADWVLVSGRLGGGGVSWGTCWGNDLVAGERSDWSQRGGPGGLRAATFCRSATLAGRLHGVCVRVGLTHCSSRLFRFFSTRSERVLESPGGVHATERAGTRPDRSWRSGCRIRIDRSAIAGV